MALLKVQVLVLPVQKEFWTENSKENTQKLKRKEKQRSDFLRSKNTNSGDEWVSSGVRSTLWDFLISFFISSEPSNRYEVFFFRCRVFIDNKVQAWWLPHPFTSTCIPARWAPEAIAHASWELFFLFPFPCSATRGRLYSGHFWSPGIFIAHIQPCSTGFYGRVPCPDVTKLNQNRIYVLVADAILPSFMISLSTEQGGGFAFLPNAYTGVLPESRFSSQWIQRRDREVKKAKEDLFKWQYMLKGRASAISGESLWVCLAQRGYVGCGNENIYWGGRSLGPYSLIFISTPSFWGKEGILSLFNLDQECHGFAARLERLIFKANFIVMRQ